jgi:Neprosin
VSDLAVNSELTEWLRDQQSQLYVTTTTVTVGGQILDWVPIESQTGGPVATSPPADLSPAAADQARPTQVAGFDTVEPGPAGHLPMVRLDLSKVGRAVGLDDFLAKRGGYLVNVNRPNKKPTDPNPFGYFHATSSQTTNIYGCDASLNVWNPAIDIPAARGGNDHSISQTWLQNHQKVKLQSLEVGLTVDRGLNGDSYNHLFNYFATNGYPVSGSNDASNGLPAIGNNIGGYRLQSGWLQYSTTTFPAIHANAATPRAALSGPRNMSRSCLNSLKQGACALAGYDLHDTKRVTSKGGGPGHGEIEMTRAARSSYYTSHEEKRGQRCHSSQRRRRE